MKKKLCSVLLAVAMTLSLAMPLTAYAEEAPAPDNGEVSTSETAAEEEEQAQPAMTLSLTGAEETEDLEPTPVPSEEPAGGEEEPAGEATNETAEEDPNEKDAVEKVAEVFEALPDAEALAALEGEEADAALEQVMAAVDAYNALTEEDAARFAEEYPELYNKVMVDLLGVIGGGISTNSLRPMQEVKNVYMTLNGYSEDALHSFPVDDVLNRLTDELGAPLGAEETDVSTLWFYFAADEREEFHTLNNDETVDLWRYLDYNYTTSSYSLTLVAGNGNQMDDAANTRYLVTVELNTADSFDFYYSIRAMYSYHIDVSYQNEREVEADYFEDVLGMPGYVQHVYDCSGSAQTPIAVRMATDEEELSRNGFKLDVYPISSFLAWRDDGAELTGAITEPLFSQGTGGVSADYTTPATADTCRTANNVWVFVFTDRDTGAVRGYFGVEVQIHKTLGSVLSMNLLAQDGRDVLSDNSNYVLPGGNSHCTIDTSNTENVADIDIYGLSVSFSARLPEGYSKAEDYVLKATPNEDFKSVYEGYFSSEQQAIDAGAEDITEQFFGDGYTANYEFSHDYTLVFSNGECAHVYVYLSEYSEPTPTPEPTIDLAFQINGTYIMDESGMRRLASYVALDAGGIPLDTYYRYDEKYDVGGYQLLLINSPLYQNNINFNWLVPVFSTPEGVQVNSGRRVESGKTQVADCQMSTSIDNTVAYQVQIPGQEVQNYQVTFATVQPEATLFVAGPDERFLNLTADNNYIHDILVANLGQTNLEGVTVELIDPVHVKLDTYWTIGGEGNDMIPAFTETSPYYTDENGEQVYEGATATLSNIAKVRLQADGAGEVSGTLRITAANGQSRDIKLTGIAATPLITTTELDEGVKYVPYSYMIATDNMYRWNRTTFRITEGELPEGLELYEKTGEIYGTPQETGTFPITVEVQFSDRRFAPATASFDLVVKENTNENVYLETDEGYMIETHLGVEQGEGTYDFYLEDYSEDQLYVSAGEFYEFEDLWLNGEKLVRNVDYFGASGSTRLTIRSQTFADKAVLNGANTIAAEFRVEGDRDNELKRTAQNFRLPEDGSGAPVEDDSQGSGNGDQGGGSGNNQGGNTGSNNQSGSSTNQGSGSTSQGSGNQASAAGQAAQQQATATANTVGLNIYLVDQNDQPIAGALVELHSTPRTATTSAGGIASFANVEFGAHTLYVKDSSGSVIASKAFTLASGSAGLSGDTVTAMGGTTLTLRVKMANGQLSFTRVSVPQTADTFNYVLWIGLLAVSAAGLTGLTIYRKKQRN